MTVPVLARRIAWWLVGIAAWLAFWYWMAEWSPSAAVIPTPGELVRQMVADLPFYWSNAQVTLSSAGQGYLWGNLIGIGGTLLVSRIPILMHTLERAAVTAIALPLVAVAPLLMIMFSGNTPAIILAAHSVVFTGVVYVLIGLRAVNATTLDVIHSGGGGELDMVLKARLPAALPQIVAALQLAAPSALLGAIVGEYMGGDRGLGIAMVNAQGSFQVARLWGLLTITSLLAGFAYVMIPVLARLLFPWMSHVGANLGAQERIAEVPGHGVVRLLRAVLSGAVTLLVLIAGWWLLSISIPNGEAVAPGPAAVLDYLIHGTTTQGGSWDAEPRSSFTLLISELGTTLIDGGVGFVAGTVFAILVAFVAFEYRVVERIVMSGSVALRSIPLLAVMPLLALIFGRGLFAVSVLTGLMTFFPTVVNLVLAMRAIPSAGNDLLKAAGASSWQFVTILRIPYVLPSLLASIKIALPLSIGAAMVAEWLATGTGLGAALTQAAAAYDYSFIWGGVFIILIVSLAVHQAAAAAESKSLERFS